MQKYENLLQAMKAFRDSYHVLLTEFSDFERTTGESVNDVPGFNDYYPLDMSFDEFPIDRWVAHIETQINNKRFKVLNYEYLNTGGNCMVGIFTVWLPALKQTVYALTNEVGCSIVTADYISNELDIDDYDEVTIDRCDFDELQPSATYFELYRYCLNEYTKSDCRYFGNTYAWPYHLLSDELQSDVPADYQMWCDENNTGCIPTDGERIIAHPDYDIFYDPHEDLDLQLNTIKDFKDFHDTIAGDEAFYSKTYDLTFDGKTIHLPFIADVWDAVNNLLETTIEEW